MSLHRTKATFIGLLEAGRVNEWVVTEKLGDALKIKLGSKSSKKPRTQIGERYSIATYPYRLTTPLISKIEIAEHISVRSCFFATYFC